MAALCPAMTRADICADATLEARCLNCGTAGPNCCAEPMPAGETYAKARTASTAANMSPAKLLEVYDRFTDGGPISPDERLQVDGIALAASFGSAAFLARMDDDQGTHAMMRAILLALVDPMHPDLDYLRSDPAAAKAARGAA
ncbi:hypothetical protein ACEUZ9_002197 [Paracoccus litorisediminis]|uniref:hypothetical protein n=1 Tax=Paracoccus litorisediminis TaxID=2006130 RepID=UPI00373487C2